MSSNAATAAPLPAIAYRRQARRLRATLSGRPDELHVALRALSAGHDGARRPIVRSVTPVIARRVTADVPPDSIPGMSAVERAFAARIVERMAAVAVFTGTDRAALLRLGHRLGVSRFRANLLIAMHQHIAMDRHAAGPRPRVPVESGRGPLPYAAVAAVVVAVEVATILVLWSRLG